VGHTIFQVAWTLGAVALGGLLALLGGLIQGKQAREHDLTVRRAEELGRLRDARHAVLREDVKLLMRALFEIEHALRLFMGGKVHSAEELEVRPVDRAPPGSSCGPHARSGRSTVVRSVQCAAAS